MDSDVKTVQPLQDFVLVVTLADGRQGQFDMKPYLDMPGLAALRDPAYFIRVGVLFGALTWPDGEDVAPATLAADLKVPHPA